MSQARPRMKNLYHDGTRAYSSMTRCASGVNPRAWPERKSNASSASGKRRCGHGNRGVRESCEALQRPARCGEEARPTRQQRWRAGQTVGGVEAVRSVAVGIRAVPTERVRRRARWTHVAAAACAAPALPRLEAAQRGRPEEAPCSSAIVSFVLVPRWWCFSALPPGRRAVHDACPASAAMGSPVAEARIVP